MGSTYPLRQHTSKTRRAEKYHNLHKYITRTENAIKLISPFGCIINEHWLKNSKNHLATRDQIEGHEGMNWGFEFAYSLTGKLDLTSWEWDLGMKK